MEVLDLSGGVKVEPLVSIITPSYNSEKYLDAFFISILEQDYEKYEVIFINDGSTDRTENIVYKYKEKFEERNIRFVYLKQENGGQAKAMNLGFPYIQGKYFIWPNSDDELYRNNISEKVKYMEQHPDIPLAMSGADYVDESGNVIKRLQRIKPEKDNFFDTSLVEETIIKIKNMNITTTIIIKSTVPVGFTEKIKIILHCTRTGFDSIPRAGVLYYGMQV